MVWNDIGMFPNDLFFCLITPLIALSLSSRNRGDPHGRIQFPPYWQGSDDSMREEKRCERAAIKPCAAYHSSVVVVVVTLTPTPA